MPMGTTAGHTGRRRVFPWIKAAFASLPKGPKIFVIGPSKCATTALHRFFADQGLDSVHCRDGRDFIGIEIESRKNDPVALKAYLERHTVFSDMVYGRTSHPINAAHHFALFHTLFPDAYFIFNDRDEDDLIRSMARHRGGSALEARAEASARPLPDLLDDIRRDYRTHKSEVLAYFDGHDRFLHFRVDREPIETLIQFLAPSYELSADHWSRHNVTGQGPARRKPAWRTTIRRLRTSARSFAVPFVEIDPSVYAKIPLLALVLMEGSDLFG